MDNSQLEKIRHSLAHLLAMAVKEVRPQAKLAIGPVIEHGFYYDFLLEKPLTAADLPALTESMRRLVEQNLPFVRSEKSVAEATAWAEQQAEPFKVELIRDLAAEGETTVSFYTTGDNLFTDLCRGPHIASTKEIPAAGFALTKIAGAYWRGDERREQLTRIYGVAFATAQELQDYLTRLAESEKRDHRRLGRELDLFTFSSLVGSGLPLFTPRGTVVRTELIKLVSEVQREYSPFEPVVIPHIAKRDLYQRSGHWDKFANDLFHVTGKHDSEFVIKPMNCPHHIQIFASKQRSYRDLPIRYGEVTTCYRDEQPGELAGLTRVRAFAQDDGHVFCRADQIETEVVALLKTVRALYEILNIPLTIRLSLRDPKEPKRYLGDEQLWQRAEATLARVLEQHASADFERAEGEAAFYGPKIDFIGRDALERQWQLATIQLDFNLPERFALEYAAADGKAARPVMIHRALLGSLERFMAILIEHYNGRFPLWLAPEQVRLVTVSSQEKHVVGATKLASELRNEGLRVTVDDSTETVGKKIALAERERAPVMVVVGDQELEHGIKRLRLRADLATDSDDTDQTVGDTTEFVLRLQKAITERTAKL